MIIPCGQGCSELQSEKQLETDGFNIVTETAQSLDICFSGKWVICNQTLPGRFFDDG